MRVGHLISHLFFLYSLVSVCFCKTDVGSFHVVGSAQCVDCKKNNFMTSQAFAGLHVTIDCKLKNGNMNRIGVTELNEQGYFKVTIPEDIVQENGKDLKEKCYAQLHNAVALPCSAPNSFDASKIVFKPSQNTFAPTRTLQFSATLCTSMFLWPYFNPNHPWFRTPNPPSVMPPVEPVPTPPAEMPPMEPVPTPPTVMPPVEPVPTPPAVMPPVEPVPTPPAVTPPVEPVPTPPAVTPPVEPLPPTTPEPPAVPLPPATTVPPVEPTPPSVPCQLPPHPFFRYPNKPCPPSPGY